MKYLSSKDYVVAIPSYKRPTELGEKTLTMLERQRVPKDRVYIFVANKNEERAYDELYGKSYNIVVGKKGLVEQLEFIVRYFEEGQPIVRCDDDVEQVWEKTGDHTCRVLDLGKFIPDAFKRTEAEGLNMWGVNVAHNIFFTHFTTSTQAPRLVGGAFMGWFNRKGKQYKYNYRSPIVEDIEKSILFHRNDGGIVRFNYVGFDADYNAPGGLQSTEGQRTIKAREREVVRHIRKLMKMYPAYKQFLANHPDYKRYTSK
jgi:hypothetical protein